MTIPQNFGLYAILTDPLKGYDYMTRLFVDEGVPFIQLRVKNAPVSDIVKIAERLRTITQSSASRFIINDDPRLAALVGADGVHLGQSDMPYTEARTIVGPHACIGISTLSPEQNKTACALKPDYIGIGPVYKTSTKLDADPEIGIDGLKNMLALATVPAVAIGGIDLTNLREVLAAGAQNFCMVRQLMKVENPREVLREIRKIYEEYDPSPAAAGQ